jgi:hypothetical protein
MATGNDGWLMVIALTNKAIDLIGPPTPHKSILIHY